MIVDVMRISSETTNTGVTSNASCDLQLTLDEDHPPIIHADRDTPEKRHPDQQRVVRFTYRAFHVRQRDVPDTHRIEPDRASVDDSVCRLHAKPSAVAVCDAKLVRGSRAHSYQRGAGIDESAHGLPVDRNPRRIGAARVRMEDCLLDSFSRRVEA
jgi:hypothetical protein